MCRGTAVVLMIVCGVGCLASPGFLRAAEDSPAAGDSLKQSLRYSGRTFEEWQVSLASDLDIAYRVKAIQALAAFAGHGYASEAVASLRPLTRGESTAEREAAVRALGSIGAPALPTLVELLKDKSYRPKRLVLDALGELGADADEATPEIVPWAKADEPEMQRAALVALIKIGRPETLVIETLRSLVTALPMHEPTHQSLVEATILNELERTTLPPEATNRLWIELLSHPEAPVSAFAARALTWYGTESSEVMTALTDYYAAQLSGPLPRNLTPSFSDRGNNALVFKTITAAVEKLNLSNPAVRNSQLMRNFMLELRNRELNARHRQPNLAAVSPKIRPLPEAALAPFVALVLGGRQDGPIEEIDLACLELLRQLGPAAAAALPSIAQLRKDVDKIPSDNNRRFWLTVIDQTSAAIRDVPSAEKEGTESTPPPAAN